MNRSYEFDAAEMKDAVLSAAAKSAVSTTQNQELAEAAWDAVNDAAAAGNFEAASHLIQVGQSAARKVRDTDLAKRFAARGKSFASEKKELQLLNDALLKLKTSPADPVANRIVGRHRCFVLDDWGSGLPMLATGDDTGFKSVARAELAVPTEAAAIIALGDAWWQLSESCECATRPPVRRLPLSGTGWPCHQPLDW